MKRSLITLAIGTLFVAPAFANYEAGNYETGLKPGEIQPGVEYGNINLFTKNWRSPAADKSRAQVHQSVSESGPTAFQNIYKGYVDRTAQPVPLQQPSDRTRAEVRAEVVELYRDGELIADNAELGKDWREM